MKLFTKPTGDGRRRLSKFRVIMSALILIVLMSTAIMLSLGWFRTFEILQHSMYPTLQPGDRVVVDARPGFTPHVGEVIAVKNPREGQEWFCKRLVAGPGDIIEFQNGQMYVNGFPRHIRGLDKSELHRWDPRMDVNPVLDRIELMDNQYYVIGDNLDRSYDSRYFGSVGLDDIIGKVWFIYWPRERWKFVQSARYENGPPESE